ncbi:MAG: permease-like cell division protein FtsX [Pseudomonadota bacterium]|nr:permease-like cell division protein FtsX [Pseudomonadota bacterium]
MKQHIQTWLKQHAHAFFFSLGQYIKNPINNILTTFVIGISLAFPVGFYVFLNNVQILSSGWDDSIEINLFLDTTVDEEQANIFANRISKRDDVAETILINKDKALAEYKKLSGLSGALDVLDENPFPNVILVKPVFMDIDEYKTTKLINELEVMPEIDDVQYDNTWIKRLIHIIDIVKLVTFILSVLLAIAVLLIVGNTIRLSIYSYRHEIEITKLFGGTDSFIQRPFLYGGVWYGIFGSVIAWFLIAVSIQILSGPIENLSNLYAGDFQLVGLGVINTLYLFGIGVLLGLLGSWASVKRYLYAIEAK